VKRTRAAKRTEAEANPEPPPTALIADLSPDLLWRYYMRGYHCLVRSGRYFRQVLRPALSHVYFQRAIPLLLEYARANRDNNDLPPGFGEQMEACPLTPRDLLHLDYAICLGYAEALGADRRALRTAPLLDWPGPVGLHGVFIAVDSVDGGVLERAEEVMFEEPEQEDEEENDGEGGPPEPPYDV
jgi:hypothetical protein